ncbi:MAG: N-6 DNA methylase [Nitrospiraceae bacterium]|nr:N-6 DNA methylase [Nitrospiraceae bacterium]
MLFAELCVKQTKPGGRIALILPNGYLGNRSTVYTNFREWLLRHCRIASICSFPRFTFQTSGADVSASVVFLQRRKRSLAVSSLDRDYAFHVGMIQNVGWELGKKKASPIFVQNEKDGSYIVDEESGERVIDADFDAVLDDMRTSLAVEHARWIVDGYDVDKGDAGTGWSVSIAEIVDDADRTLDPKRYSKKYKDLLGSLKKSRHLRLTAIVDVVPQATNAAGKLVKLDRSKTYTYTEIQDISYGDYRSTEMRGWQLPQRARHFAEAGDIYVGGVWGSVAKWFLVDNVVKNLVVTNGCYRLRVKAGMEDALVDLVAFLCSEAYSTQMRSLARGSDGLAEVHEIDLSRVIVPVISDQAIRNEVRAYVDALMEGKSTIASAVNLWIDAKKIGYPKPPKRPHHSVLV